MKKLLLITPLAFIACSTTGSDSGSDNNSGQIDFSDLKSHTLIDQEVVDGETRSFKFQVTYNAIEWQPEAGYVVLETPGSQCENLDDEGEWSGEYYWKSNKREEIYFTHEDTLLEWKGLDYIGGPELFSKWSWGDSEERNSLTLSENNVIEVIDFEIECYSDSRPLGKNAEKVNCSTLEITDLPKKLTVRNYRDSQMGLHEVFTYGDESCERYIPYLNTEESCNLYNELINEEDPCDELLSKLAQIKGTDYVSICREDLVKEDGYCDEECLNLEDPDCE